MVIELVPVTLEPVELKPVELLQTGAAPGGGAPAVRIAGVSETGLVYDSDLIRLDVSGGAHTQTLNMNLPLKQCWVKNSTILLLKVIFLACKHLTI